MKSRYVFPATPRPTCRWPSAGRGLAHRCGRQRYLDASGGRRSVPGAFRSRCHRGDQGAGRHARLCPYRLFHQPSAEALAEKLVSAPEDRAGLLRLGGSEAMESAIKLARQYFLEIGQKERRNVIARWQSYHGNTIGALSAGAIAGGRAILALYGRGHAPRLALPCLARQARGGERRRLRRQAGGRA